MPIRPNNDRLMKTQIKLKSIIPADLYFYSIPLDNSRMELSRGLLDKHYHEPPKSAQWRGLIRSKYINFENDVVAVLVELPNERPYQIYLHVSPAELHLGCECRMPGGKLCRHAYYGVGHLLKYDGKFDLKEFYWPGLNDQKKINKFLKIRSAGSYMTIAPREG